ncbi:MAG: peptidoglycan editing factor PgeF [Chlamydiales bacterium]|nr:peptidoglycan editing factor PgeF [Chlamydiales bacterium]
MERHSQDLLCGLEWLAFENLSDSPRLIHGVFLRHGGVSKGSFQSLNFGLSQGDSPTAVEINRKRALSALGIGRYVNLYQKHSDQVIEAEPQLKSEGDSLITDRPDLGLLILHADCQAAIFYDPVRHALANVHAGWRGSVANIYRKTIERMKARYGTKPEDLLVGISPSLGPNGAEFLNYRRELPESFWPFQMKPFYFDFWEISRAQLIEAGVLAHHIEIARLCTYTDADDFFSYRRVKVSGRHGTIAALKA